MKYLFLLLPLVTQNAHARWLTKQESGSIVEKFNVEYEVQKNGASTQIVEYVVRVQSEDAKVSASVFQVDYNSFTDKVEILEAYTQNGKDKTKVPSAAIEDRDKGEAKDYDVMKVRTVVFPQVQIGSRLYIKYKVVTAKPIIEGRWSTVISLSPSYFVDSFSLRVKSEIPLFYEVRDPQNFLSFTQTRPTAFQASNRKTLPGWVHAEKDPYFHPARYSEIWLTTHKEWPDFFAPLSQDYEKLLSAELPPKMKAWIDQAKKKKSTPDKVKFLMEKMSVEFRYFGDWRRHDGGLLPRPLAEIEESRYGDCKDLATLLTSMLRNLKLNAHVALVRRGENPYGAEPDYKLPSVNRFNHAIVHVKDGALTYWLDPTNPVSSLKAYADISGRPSWLISGSGGEFVRLPEAKPAEFEHIQEYEYHFDGDDTVKVKLNAQLNDLAASDVANDLMLASRSAVLSETLEYFTEGQDVKSFKWLREPKTGRTLEDLKVTLEYEAGRVTFNAGKAQFWVLPDGFMQGAFYETDNRESDIQLAQTPYLFKGIRRLKDTRLMQDIPDPCKVQSDWLDVERAVKVEGRDVVITHRIELKKPFIQQPEFRSAAFKKLQDGAKRCFYRSGVLVEPINGRLSTAAQ